MHVTETSKLSSAFSFLRSKSAAVMNVLPAFFLSLRSFPASPINFEAVGAQFGHYRAYKGSSHTRLAKGYDTEPAPFTRRASDLGLPGLKVCCFPLGVTETQSQSDRVTSKLQTCSTPRVLGNSSGVLHMIFTTGVVKVPAVRRLRVLFASLVQTSTCKLFGNCCKNYFYSSPAQRQILVSVRGSLPGG